MPCGGSRQTAKSTSASASCVPAANIWFVRFAAPVFDGELDPAAVGSSRTACTRSYGACPQAVGAAAPRALARRASNGRPRGGTMPDKVMLITGASRGIGAATARLAAARGYAVAINYLGRRDAAEAVAADVRQSGRRAAVIQADIGKPAEVARLFARVDAEFGRLDAFFNNAGTLSRASRFVDIAPERLQQILAVNSTGAFIAA